MKITDVGVSSDSFMDFLLPSDFAKEALYTIDQFGHFFCNQRYRIERDYVDLYLLVYIRNGAMTVHAHGKEVIAQPGDVVLLDCHEPHHYGTAEDTLDFLWFHFNGNASRAYCDFLLQEHGVLYHDDLARRLGNEFEMILAQFRQLFPNEHQISLRIHSILSQLAAPKQPALPLNPLLTPAFAYIHEHYAESIGVNKLASLCCCSVSHFIRQFKQYAHSTPHEYLLNYRLRQSKQLLLTTALPVEAIGERCGFNSPSHFTRAFRTSNGQTPTDFRRMYL